MAQLQPYPQGGADHQGKPRVYFCCHEADRNAYLEPICREILRLRSCVFYHYPDGRPNSSTQEMDLTQMKLLVMPVTTRLLTEPNDALDLDFPFAIAHHIPVLPLMMESGLEQLFNDKCGDLQFLDPNDRDITAIPYQEKLKKYLDSVLISDAVAKKIRAAFDAYIFLSYRKKDRSHAQELMRLVHKNEFCRNIAIWYDEFLTPGENFNHAIQAALEKSDLFALAVTPNLINEENYVCSIEFPMAQQAGKPILPVEFIPTDSDTLRREFPGIPDCTEAKNEGALAGRLQAAIRSLALQTHPQEPQHDFFIGLAYLSGIDMEVDHAKALELIHGAAEAGLPEAMDKLAAMYHNGEGVARDYDAELHWLRGVAEDSKEQFQNHPDDPQAAGACCARLQRLGDALHALRQHQDAAAVYRELTQATQAITKRWRNHISRSKQAFSFEKLGHALYAAEEYAAAEEAYQQNASIREAVYREMPFPQRRSLENPKAAEAYRQWGLAYLYLGDTYRKRGNLRGARSMYYTAQNLLDVLHREVGNYRSKADLIALYERLAMVLQPVSYTSDDPQAREYRQKALQLRQELGTHLDHGDGQRSTARHLAATGSLLMADKQYADARNHFLQARDIFLELAKKTGSVQARQDLARIYGNLASISLSREESEGHHRAAMEIWNTLLEETGQSDIQVHLSDCCHFLSRIRREAGDYAQANAFCREALGHIQAAVQAVPIPEYQYILASRWDALGNMENALGNLTAAKAAYLAALKIRQEVSQNTMNTSWNGHTQESVQYESAPACRALTESLYNLIPLCYRIGQIEEARQYARQLMRIVEVVLKYSHTPAARVELGRSCAALATLEAAQKDASSAEMLYQKAAALFSSAAAEENTPKLQRMQGRCYFDLGNLLQTRDPKKAQTYFCASQDLYEALTKQTQEAADQQMLALVLHQIGLLSLDAAPIRRACEILEDLIRRDPDNQEYPRHRKNAENSLRRVKLLRPLSGLFGK